MKINLTKLTTLIEEINAQHSKSACDCELRIKKSDCPMIQTRDFLIALKATLVMGERVIASRK